jgi:hypothetical protein
MAMQPNMTPESTVEWSLSLVSLGQERRFETVWYCLISICQLAFNPISLIE